MSDPIAVKNNFRIIIADDHELVVQALRSFLSDKKKYEIIGTAYNGKDAINLVEANKPDIAILDVSMPELTGIEAAQKIQQVSPDTKIIIYSIAAESERIVELIKLGVSAYITKDEPLSNVLLALDSVTAGGSYFSHSVRQSFDHIFQGSENTSSDNSIQSKLSKREFEIFLLLVDGVTIKEIGFQLHISPRTVEKHKYSIFKKLNVNNQSDLIKLGIKEHLVDV